MMNSKVEQPWYDKVRYSTAQSAHCPRCGQPFPMQAGFDHHVRAGIHCGTELTDWALTEAMYVIDVQKAPGLLRVMIVHLERLQELEADEALTELEAFLSRDRLP